MLCQCTLPKREPPVKQGARPLAELGVLQSQTLEPEHRHDLMITKVRVGNSIASYLIDSGATPNFISSEWAEKARITTTENGKQIVVTVADGRHMTFDETKTSMLTLNLGGFQWRESFTVIPMTGYDIILGKPWLSDIQPNIDYKTNRIQLKDKTTAHQVTVECLSYKNGSTPNLPKGEFVTIKQAGKAWKKGAETIIVKLEPVDAQTPAYDIQVEGEQRSEIWGKGVPTPSSYE